MILVTGGTGFIGQELIRHLVERGYQVRILLRPSYQSPRLPRGVPVEAVVCSLKDERGLRAAMKGGRRVSPAGAEQSGSRADLQAVDIDGSRLVAEAAAGADVERLVYLSHLGADRASAFPVLKVKGIAEHFIMQSGVPTPSFVRRSFWPRRPLHHRAGLALRMSPFVFLLPGNGATFLNRFGWKTW
jgi:NADH dehydrogenase